MFPLLTLKKYLQARIFIMKCQDLVYNLVVYVKLVDTCVAAFVILARKGTGKAPEDATLMKELRKNETITLT